MKLSKKIIALFAAAVLAFALLAPGALAAGDTEVEAGKTAEVIFIFADVYNVDGAFTVSDPEKILSSYSISVADAGSTAAVVNGDRLWASPAGEPKGTTLSIKVALSVKSSAAVGSCCTVSFNGIYGAAGEEAGNEHDITRTSTVMVTAAAPKPSPTPKPTPTPTPTPKPTPTPITSKIDYTELEKQLTIADGLNSGNYTEESRTALADAVRAARDALDSTDQDTVTAAAEALRTTITGLKSMDYSKLKPILVQAEETMISDPTGVLWQHLCEAVGRGSELLQSGDQQAVDRAVDELTDLLGRVDELLKTEPETKVVIQEVPVEVLPSGDYCNITNHRLWPVIAICSLAVNLILIAVIVGYVIRKTKNRKDETPLVDYDIDDDF